MNKEQQWETQRPGFSINTDNFTTMIAFAITNSSQSNDDIKQIANEFNNMLISKVNKILEGSSRDESE